MDREDSVQPSDVPLVKRPFQPPPQLIRCGYCLKSGHSQRNCQLANGLHLICGSWELLMGDCPLKETKNDAPVRPALPAPPVMRNPWPFGRGAPLLSKQQAYGQAQKGARVGTDGRRIQAYHLTVEEVRDQNVEPNPRVGILKVSPWPLSPPFIFWVGNLSLSSPLYHIIIFDPYLSLFISLTQISRTKVLWRW